jgi:hypothetical protein
MSICYIILTCEKYQDTRVKWQLETMLKNINKNDIYFLGHKMDVENRLYNWGAADDYNSLPYKFIDFFKNIYIEYDWYILIDDDTYVYHDKLHKMLEQYSKNNNICIGRLLRHIEYTVWGSYFSGGAGTVLSHGLYNAVRTYVRVNPIQNLALHWCADICLGLWIKQFDSILYIDNHNFHTAPYNTLHDDAENAITFHHLKDRNDYYFHRNLGKEN